MPALTVPVHNIEPGELVLEVSVHVDRVQPLSEGPLKELQGYVLCRMLWKDSYWGNWG